MPSFKVPCLSCEHQVLIKDAKLIGTKVECPKCKYRFKVEEPKGGMPGEDANKGKGKTPANEGDDAAKKKKKKKLVAIVVGVLAVGVLGAVGYAVMGGGGKDNKNQTKSGGPTTRPPGNTTPPANPNPDPATDPKKDPKDPKEPPKEEWKPKEAIREIKVNPSDKETTNLFPGQTVALYRFDIAKIRNRTQIASQLFDPLMLDMFKDSFGFHPDEIEAYYHTFVGNTRDPFGVIRIRVPVAEKEIISKMPLAEGSKKIKGLTLHTFKTNPFVNGVANVLSQGSLLSDLFVKAPPTPIATPDSRVIGVCVYDSQHILVADATLLENYLEQLERGIDPDLKKILKKLGSESTVPPVLYAEKYVQGLFNPKFFKPQFQPVAAILDPILNRLIYIGANLDEMSTRHVTANIQAVMASEVDAQEVVKDQLIPGLTLAAQATTVFLGEQVELRYQGKAMGVPGSGVPGSSPYPGTGTSPYPGSGPGTPPAKNGPGPIRPGPMPPNNPAMPGAPKLPGPGGSAMVPRGPGGQMGGMEIPGGSPPGGPQGVPAPAPKAPSSFIDLESTDNNIAVKFDIHWTDDAYRRLLFPALSNFTSNLKGKMQVYASNDSFHGLPAAVKKMIAENKAFPPGTIDRRSDTTRIVGLKHPPDTRVSFYASMLPFMGRAGLARSINPELAWFDNENLTAASAWVPEFLVPSYPQSAWRATSPYVHEGITLGGTNYVAIAGVGVNAARYNPTNPEHAKKVGLIGYDWGSKVDEVTDGLSNTIFLMQTPPGFSQPWIQGGGATIRGLDEKDPMRGFRHNYNTPNGQEGTYVLMGDGSVRFVSGKISPKVLLAMGTRAGGEDLKDDLDKEAPRVDLPPKVESPKSDGEVKADPKPEPSPMDPKTPIVKKPIDTPLPKKEPTPSVKLEVAPAPREK
jgi:hypothetical protein